MTNVTPSQTTLGAGSNVNEVPSLLVPIDGGQLVLPTVSIAEMLPLKEPVPSTEHGDTPWYMGQVLWRGLKVPMVSYEAMNGGSIAETRAISQMAILNNTGVDARLPFLCFPTQGIPHLNRVLPENSDEDKSKKLAPYDKMHVFLSGISATIPDVAKMEKAIIDLLF